MAQLLEYKSRPFEWKANLDQGIIEGHASTFDEVEDHDDDIADRGAFIDTIAERHPQNLIKLKWLHVQPLGIITDISEDSVGLAFRGKISMTAANKDRIILMKDRAVDRLSIGFKALQVAWEEVRNKIVRHLQKVLLFEISAVELASNENAIITAIKSQLIGLDRRLMLPSGLNETKAVLQFRNLALADRARRWDASAAEKRVRTWAGAEEAPNAKYSRAWVWVNADERDQFSGYKLLIGDVIDGELKTVPRGVFAAAGVVQGARGGVDIPEGEMAAVRRHLERYYAKMREEFDDEGVIAPWNKSLTISPSELKTIQSARSILTRLIVSATEPASMMDADEAAIEQLAHHAVNQLRGVVRAAGN